MSDWREKAIGRMHEFIAREVGWDAGDGMRNQAERAIDAALGDKVLWTIEPCPECHGQHVVSCRGSVPCEHGGHECLNCDERGMKVTKVWPPEKGDDDA